MTLSVTDAVAQRKSIRAFTDEPVDDEALSSVLKAALRAPSGGNVQPWRLFVLNGDAMTRFKTQMEEQMASNPIGEPAQYEIYPKGLKAPYRDWRFGVGEDMYALLGIARDDKMARLTWLQNNYRFFGAPAAVFCFIDRDMLPPQWSDLGMYLQTAMLLFQERGLATCAQEAWSRWPETVSKFVGAPDEMMLFCGLAVGHADTEAPVNGLVSKRAPEELKLSFVK
jgi:nitroreductase